MDSTYNYLHEAATTQFLLLPAELNAGKANRALKASDVPFLVVQSHDAEGTNHYYLFEKFDALEALYEASTDTPLPEVLQLARRAPLKVLDAFTPVAEAPAQCMVLDDGLTIRFYDSSLPPGDQRHGEATRGGEGILGEPDMPSQYALTASFPDRVQLAQTYSLYVGITADEYAQGGATLLLEEKLEAGSEVEVMVSARKGFELEGSHEKTLVFLPSGEPQPLQFKLTATDPGRGDIRVYAYHLGQPLGAITLKPEVQPLERAAFPAVDAQHRQGIERISLHQPDLTLIILEERKGTRLNFKMFLTGRNPELELNYKRFDSPEIRRDPTAFITEFYHQVEKLSTRKPYNPEITAQRLAAMGARLYNELFPDDLRQLLWRLQDQITSVLIQADEPWIPWEMCRLVGRENGRVVEGPYLCEKFALTRWIPSIEMRSRLGLNRMALVVPRDAGLPNVKAERDYLLNLNSRARGVERITAGYSEVREAMARGEYDAWHFSGHGGFHAKDVDHTLIVLENEEPLRVEDLNGITENVGITHPLVFLNACQVGRADLGLTGLGGWAQRFLKVGASAFIGAYWLIQDKPAYLFTTYFYDNLLKQQLSIGEATRQARLSIKALGTPDWLAYTVYANPLAKVEL